jgi:cytochrome c-type biogenesis protein CcmH
MRQTTAWSNGRAWASFGAMNRSLLVTVSALSLFAFACDAELPETPSALASRMLAPCCYKQTLDVHASELATEVRSEIKKRMSEGASAAAVEAELVAKYGERIRAVPNRHFLNPLGTAGMVLGGLALFGFFWFAWRSRVRFAPEPSAPFNEAVRSRLDAELAALDD